jgi:hypothetical protein
VGEGHCRRFGFPPPSASMILGPVVASNTITVVTASSIAPEEDLGAGEKVVDLAHAVSSVADMLSLPRALHKWKGTSWACRAREKEEVRRWTG